MLLGKILNVHDGQEKNASAADKIRRIGKRYVQLMTGSKEDAMYRRADKFSGRLLDAFTEKTRDPNKSLKDIEKYMKKGRALSRKSYNKASAEGTKGLKARLGTGAAAAAGAGAALVSGSGGGKG